MRVGSAGVNIRSRGARGGVAAIAAAVALALSSVVPAQAGGLEWPQFRFGPTHNGFTMSSSITSANVKTLRQRWTYGSGLQQSDPIVGNNLVYSAVGGRLIAVAAATGHKMWSRPWSGISDPAAFATCTPAICQSLLFAVSGGNRSARLVAFYASGGKTGWSFTYPGLSAPTVSPATGTVYVSSADGTLFALRSVGCDLNGPPSARPCRGKVLWKVAPAANTKCLPHRCPGINSITPTVYGGLVYVTATNGRVYATGAGRGKAAWSTNLKSTGAATTSTAVSGRHLLVATTNGAIVSLDPATGRRQWTYTQSNVHTPGVPTGLAAAYGLVFVTGLGDGPHGANPNMEALNIANGHVAWTFSTVGYSAMDPSVAARIVYVSDTSSDVYAVNVANGRQIAVIAHLGTYGPTYPAVIDGWLYVSNYAFSLPGA